MTAWAVAGCVALAAGAVAWPLPGAQARGRRVLGSARSPRLRPAVWSRSAPPPARALATAAVVGGTALAVLLNGPVAGLVAATYGGVAVRAAATRTRDREQARLRADLLDAVGSAAADLRAGIPAETALSAVVAASAGSAPVDSSSTGSASAGSGPAGGGLAGGGLAGGGLADVTASDVTASDVPASGRVGGARAGADPLRLRVASAVRLAEQTGAPLADVLERIEADARGTDRARAASAAQAAGAIATAWLLAALPAGGVALGYAIGTDPLAVLLRTPAGALCAGGALGLQLTGLAWARRLCRPGGSGGAP